MRRAIVFRPTRPAPPASYAPAQTDPFTYDRYLFNPCLLSFGTEYVIDDEDGQPLLFVRRRPLSLVLHIEVLSAENNQTVLTIHQDSLFQWFGNTYTVYDGLGNVTATVRRQPYGSMGLFWSNWRMGSWTLFGADMSPMVRAEPDPTLVMLNWIFEGPTGAVVGFWQHRLSLMDKHRLDLQPDITRSVDRRFAIALGILIELVTCR